jgi:predicted small metal-binding protein
MKELRCRDVGFQCEGVIRANTEDEVMKQAAQHAREVHGLNKLDDATAQKIRSKIQTR